MHALKLLFWLGLIILHQNINAFPTTFSIRPVLYPQHTEIQSTGLQQEHGAGLRRSRLFGRVPPKQGTSAPKAPVTNPLSKPGPNNKGSNIPPDDKKDKGKGPAPQTPAAQIPKGQTDKKYFLGECGFQDEGDSIRNVDRTGKTPARKPKTINALKTPKAPKAKNKPANADDDWAPPVTGTKSMLVCGPRVNMNFPNYPSSGDVTATTHREKYEKIMVAYNAKVIDPCKDDYTFGKLPFPKSKEDGVYSYHKKSEGTTKKDDADIWQTEHVMDAQILKRFFQDMFEDVTVTDRTREVNEVTGSKRLATIKRTDIPAQWVSSAKGTATKQDQCDYLDQFWTKRWANKGANASTYNRAPSTGHAVPKISKDRSVANQTIIVAELLGVYPSDNHHEVELLLLPGRLNNKKASLFSVDGHNVISTEKFAKLSFHEKVDELRELILLMGVSTTNIPLLRECVLITQYLNTPDVAKYWKALAIRIRDGLARIDADGDKAFMRATDDWWYKQKNKDELKDPPNGKYKSVKLAAKWPTWINKFVKTRTTAMSNLLLELFWELENDWENAKTYAELQVAPGDKWKAEFEVRMTKLKAQINTTVKVQPYAIGPESDSRPGTPDMEDSGSEGAGGGSSDSDTPIDTPSKPPKNIQPGQPVQPINLPSRPKPVPKPSPGPANR